MFEKLEIQKIIFDPKVSRLDLLNVKQSTKLTKPLKVNVWRNHNFESVIPLINPYMAYQNIDVTFNLSSYDHSLSFSNYSSADLEIIWLDSRYLANNTGSIWLQNRILFLKTLSTSPIVVVSWDLDFTVINDIPSVYFLDVKEKTKKYNYPFLNMSLEKSVGSPLHKDCQKLIAKILACHYIPQSLFTGIKAVCLDLDNTLYSGVLGEDGPLSLTLTKNHKYLHSICKELASQGILLALVTKNNKEDVERLFSLRKDFDLDYKDFITVEASWDSKSISIKNVATKLRISLDSILFIDDNVGELYEVHTNLPTVNILLATYNSGHSLEFYPGLKKLKISETDNVRKIDLLSNNTREKILFQETEDSYFKKLNTHINFNFNCKKQLHRIYELSQKTNQFNLALKRYSQDVIYQKMSDPTNEVIGISVSDNLSDSGIVGFIIGKHIDKCFTVEELCLSCRSLGRRLENVMIISPLLYLSNFYPIHTIKFDVVIGNRNQPATNWLNSVTGSNTTDIPLEAIKKIELPNNIKVFFKRKV